MDCPKDIYRVLLDYCSGRKVFFQVGQDKLARDVSRGCPQGSILGPLLWNILFNGLLEVDLPQGCVTVAYADDATLLVRGDTRLDLEQKGQIAARALEAWCRRSGLAVSRRKSCLMVFRGVLRRPPVIRFTDGSIRSVDHHAYLGVVLDSRLNFNLHVDSKLDKAVALMQKVRRLARANWGLEYPAIKTIYKGLFEGIATYAAGVWGFAARKKTMQTRLLRAQRRALLCVTRAYNTVSTEALPVIAGIIPLDLLVYERYLLYRLKRGLDYEQNGQIYLATDPNNLNERTVRSKIIKETTIVIWQRRWEGSTKGRWTFEFFPDVNQRRLYKWVIPTHNMTQFLSGHGVFKAKLHGFGLTLDGSCSCGEEQTCRHELFNCPRLEGPRARLRTGLWELGVPWPCQCGQLVRTAGRYELFKNYVADYFGTAEDVR